jgi:hypothetical protein
MAAFGLSTKKSPFGSTSYSIGPYDPDMRAACWRFITRGEGFYGNLKDEQEYMSSGAKGRRYTNTVREIKDVWDQIESVFYRNADAVRRQFYHIDDEYTNWYEENPNFVIEDLLESQNFKTQVRFINSQMKFEADRWSLDLKTLKGCYFYYATSGRGSDAAAIGTFKKIIGYSGNPIPPPGSNNIYYNNSYTRGKAGKKRARR